MKQETYRVKADGFINGVFRKKGVEIQIAEAQARPFLQQGRLERVKADEPKAKA